ncbi:methyl-accepting chemotaxis protein [Oceanospirillum sediminis]|uniref:Methyl-accepting chemotaxis protein n=1 Tax=Oceanospirillum sediminis TaxID=2760088 RepID=A0A839INF6_9GAMM|nr:methyl-accepting chemotaxis protein [Oceanospirillum sediminis]MBB1486230.1 methyl-accepting chemotaxis protein [Oceanospirillum sediminis]
MNSYSHLSLRWQISIPVFLLSIFIVILGGSGYLGITAVSQQSDIMARHLTPATSAILNADRDLYQATTAMRDYVSMSEDRQASRQDFDDNAKQAFDRMMKARQLVASVGVEMVDENQFRTDFSQWKTKAQQVFTLADQGKISDALALIRTEEGKLFGALRDQYDALGESIDKQSSRIADNIISTQNKEMTKIVAILILASVLSLLVVIYIPRMVVSAIKQLERMLSALADGGGDLTQRIPAEGDNEIASLAMQVNRFIEFLQTMIAEARIHTHEMHSVVDDLCKGAEETSQSAEHQQQSVNQIHTAVTELQNAINEIADNAMQSSNEANQVHQDVSASGQAIHAASSQITTLSDDMQNVVALISELEKESTNIVSVLDVIGGIAEQTNLLALNAAIEAARAGEAGRGFAVVADEVRTLASKTQQSTQDIQEMIDRLQAGVNNAVSAMQKANSEVAETVTRSESASEALDRIVQGVNRINDMSTQIAAATEEQSSVALHMSETVSDVNKHTEALNRLAAKTKTSGNSLHHSTGALSGHMNRFRV